MQAERSHIPRGEQSALAELTDAEVALMRELYAERDDDGSRHWCLRTLADKFDVSKSYCGKIIAGTARTYG